MKDSNDGSTFLERLGAKVASAYFVIVLILLLACASWMSFVVRFDQFATWTPLYLLLGAGVIFLVFLVVCLAHKRVWASACVDAVRSWLMDPRHFALVVVCAVAAIIIWDIILYYEAGFRTDWDVAAVANGGAARTPSVLGAKLSRDPNLAFLAGLFGKLRLVGTVLGSSDPYWVLVAGALASMVLSSILSTYIVKNIMGPLWALVSLVVLTVLVGISPWFFIPYSDQYGMLPICLIAWLYLYYGEKPVAWGIMATVTAIGYAIKPTTVFIFVSVVVYTAVRAIKKLAHKKERFSYYFRYLAFIVVGVVVGWVVVLSVYPSEQSAPIDTTQGKGMAHFLMMGAREGNGAFDGRDTALTLSIADPDERTQENLRVFKERIADMGPMGLLAHWTSKTLCNFDNGSFAWTHEGVFYSSCQGNGGLLQRFYGIPTAADVSSNPELLADREGLEETTCSAPYFRLCQVLWFAVLEGIAIAGFFRLPAKKREAITLSAVLVSVMVLGLFLMIFEARARYLIHYLPLFVIGGLWGWKSMAVALRRSRPVLKSIKS